MAYIHTYIHANLPTYRPACKHVCRQTYMQICVHACIHTYTHTYIHTYMLLISMLWHRQAIFESKGDNLYSSAKCRIRTQRVSETQSSADWMPADKPTELSRIKLKTWTRHTYNACMHAYMHACIQTQHVHTYCKYVWMYVYVCMLVCICIYMYIKRITAKNNILLSLVIAMFDSSWPKLMADGWWLTINDGKYIMISF